MVMIEKKTWPDLFQLVWDGKKMTEIRLADFDIAEGDTLMLREYDPKTQQYTGREIAEKVMRVNKVFLTDYHTPEQIKEFGHLIIELEE